MFDQTIAPAKEQLFAAFLHLPDFAQLMSLKGLAAGKYERAEEGERNNGQELVTQFDLHCLRACCRSDLGLHCQCTGTTPPRLDHPHTYTWAYFE